MAATKVLFITVHTLFESINMRDIQTLESLYIDAHTNYLYLLESKNKKLNAVRTADWGYQTVAI